MVHILKADWKSSDQISLFLNSELVEPASCSLSDMRSHLCDKRLQQGGGAFPDTAHSEPEAATAALHDAVISLVSVQSLRQYGPDLQVT